MKKKIMDLLGRGLLKKAADGRVKRKKDLEKYSKIGKKKKKK